MNFPKLLKKLNSPILILLFLLLIIFYPVLFNGKALFHFDITSLDQGITTYTVNLIKNGEYPLFSPHMLSGVPLPGVYPPIYYPPMLLYLILPFHISFSLLAVLHLFLAGLGIYLIGLHWNFSRISSLFGAIIFSLNGYIIDTNITYQLPFASAWIPYIFLYTEKLTNENNLKNFLLLVLFSSLQLATGRLDYFYFTQMFIWIWICWKFLKIYNSTKEASVSEYVNKTEKVIYLKKIPLLILAFLFSILLLSVEIIPLLDYLKLTERKSGISIQTAVFWSLNPLQTLQLIFNNLFGDRFYNRGITALIIRGNSDFTYIGPLFYNLYIGLPTFLIIIYGTLKHDIWSGKKEKKAVPLILIALFFLFLSFGEYGYIYELFYNYLPGFNTSRYPIKLYIFTDFCFSLLAIIGFERLISEEKKDKLLKLSIYSFIFILFFLTSIYIFQEQILTYFRLILEPDNLKLDNLSFLHISVGQTFGYISLFIILLFCLKYEKINTAFFKIAVLTLICIELYFINISNIRTVNKDRLYYKPEIVTDIENRIQNKSLYRIKSDEEGKFPKLYQSEMINGFEKVINTLVGNRFLLYNLKSFEGGTFATPNTYSTIIDSLNDRSGYIKTPLETKIKILRMMGVRFYIWHKLNNILTPPDKTYYKLIKTYPLYQLELWELKDYQPIFTFKSKAIVSSSENDIYNLIFQAERFTNLDFKDVVVLFNDNNYKHAIAQVKKNTSPNIKNSNVELLEEKSSKIILKVEAPTSGYLVLANNYYEGWKAYDNSVETPILKANFYQQAIRISSGKHAIKFIYEPYSFVLGRMITLITLLLLLGLTLIAFISFYRKKHLKIEAKLDL